MSGKIQAAAARIATGWRVDFDDCSATFIVYRNGWHFGAFYFDDATSAKRAYLNLCKG